MNEEEVMERARQLRAAGVPIAEIERYIQSKLGAPKADAASGEPKADAITKILGTAASLVRDIPGMEAVQSGASALVNGIPYSEARAQIRAAEDATPKKLTIPARLAGGGIAAAVNPANAVRAGAEYGLLSALGNSDPKATFGDRLAAAPLSMAAGAAAGKVGEVAGTLAKGVAARPMGKAAEMLKKERIETTAPLYKAAMREGDAAALTGTPQAVLDALDKPDIKPFADMVRNSREFAGANDATIVRETYKLMTRQQGGLMRRLKEQGFDAKADLDLGNITAAKQELQSAADLLMPTHRSANQTFANLKAKEGAFKQTASGMNRVVNKSKVAPQNLHKNSPEALEQKIAAMTPSEAEGGLEGALGSLRENMKFGYDPSLFTGLGTTKLFGVVPAAIKANRATPFIRQLEQRAGKSSAWNALAPGSVAVTRTLEDLLRER